MNSTHRHTPREVIALQFLNTRQSLAALYELLGDARFTARTSGTDEEETTTAATATATTTNETAETGPNLVDRWAFGFVKDVTGAPSNTWQRINETDWLVVDGSRHIIIPNSLFHSLYSPL